MRFYLGNAPVRVPVALARHLPRRWVSYSFSAAEIAEIQRRAEARAIHLRGVCD